MENIESNQIIDTLDGTERCYQFVGEYRSFNIQNLSDDIMYTSLYPAISNRTQGITAIMPKGSCILENRYIEGNKLLYILGTGKVQITASNSINQVYN